MKEGSMEKIKSFQLNLNIVLKKELVMLKCQKNIKNIQ